MLDIRHLAKNSIIWTLSRISKKIDISDNQEKTGGVGSQRLHHFTILSGPVRGMKISMAQIEQVAFVIGNYEPSVTETMRRYVRPGMTVYDIGANVGYFSMVLSRWVGPGGKVFVFEPDPKNLGILRHNVVTNHLSNTTVVPTAISDQNGEVKFATFDYTLVSHIVDSGTPNDAQILAVPAITLDTFVYEQNNPPPQFIKVDVEGAEEQVVQGADRVLAEARPIIVIELRHNTVATIKAIAAKHNYRLESISGVVNRLETFDYDEHLMIPNEK